MNPIESFFRSHPTIIRSITALHCTQLDDGGDLVIDPTLSVSFIIPLDVSLTIFDLCVPLVQFHSQPWSSKSPSFEIKDYGGLTPFYMKLLTSKSNPDVCWSVYHPSRLDNAMSNISIPQDVQHNLPYHLPMWLRFEPSKQGTDFITLALWRPGEPHPEKKLTALCIVDKVPYRYVVHIIDGYLEAERYAIDGDTVLKTFKDRFKWPREHWQTDGAQLILGVHKY
eukprot:PhF_6_TR29375/c0_g1_i9/m.43266